MEIKRSCGARSGEYRGCGMIVVLFLAKKNLQTNNDMWAGAMKYFSTKLGVFFILLQANNLKQYEDY